VGRVSRPARDVHVPPFTAKLSSADTYSGVRSDKATAVEETMPNRKLAIWILAVGMVLVLSASLNAYFIRIEGGGEVLWNDNEAYLFIASNILGHHVKWIQYPLLIAREMLGGTELPDDSGGSMYVIRVTSSGVERHVFELVDRRPGSGPSMYTPMEGRIWLNYPTLGGLCWWAGDHFERATQDELRELDGINHLNNRFYRNENGWSKDMVTDGRDSTIKVGDKFELLAGGPRASDGQGAISVDMRSPGHEPTMVFNLDIRVGMASRSEYRRTFPDRK